MLKEKVSRTVLILLLISITTLAVNIQPVKADSSWVWVRDAVTGAYGEAVVGTSADIYIARGTSFYRYRPVDNSWTELAASPQPDGAAFKTGTALVWDFGDHIYALCGAATDDSRRWFYRYSILSNSWEILANTTVDQGEGNAITYVSIDNCIYATIGGEQRPTYFMRYDPSTNSWSDTPVDPPAGMGDGASLVWAGGEYLYALRGEFLETEALYDFWRYSLTDNSWTAMSDIPALPHSEGSGGVGDGGSLLYVGHWLPSHTNYIYALSGNQAHPDNIADNRTYRYTISTNSWERLADMPFGVGYYVGCRLGYAEGHIYAWQGAPSTWTGGGDDLAKYRLAWIVDDDGPADYNTIQEAINAANPRDTVFIKAGTYNENVVVNKTVSLVGEDPATTVIDGGGTSDVVRVTANNVIIKNFKIRNSGKYYAPPDSGIRVDASYCNITDNVIIDNSVGIYLEKSSYNSINLNNITNKYYGIILLESSRNNIRGNNITAHEYLGVVLSWLSSNNVISENNMTDNGGGIYIGDAWDNIVSGNNIVATSLKEGTDAIHLVASSSIIISENIITNYWAGIELSYSSSCTISNNTMNGNTYNFGVWGSTLSHFLHSIDVSNLVDGKPVYYLINQKDLTINPSTYPEIGYLALINSTNIQVEGLILTNNWHSLLLAYTNNSKIKYNTITGARNNGGVDLFRSSNNKIYGNNITDNYCGIALSDSLNNTIASNNIIDNDGYGLYLSGSSNNAIHHNNFINNNKQASSTDSINIWDDGYPSGGNFWSNYNGVDLHSGSGQVEAGSDGIGDTAHEIDADNRDRYPLMAPFTTFDAGTWNGEAYGVGIVSNSTLSDFNLNATRKTLSFNVTGGEGEAGFCRITIPNTIVQDLWQGNYTVLLNDEPWPFRNWTDTTNTYIYINYTHSEHQIIIVPEFPSSLILPLFMITTLIAVILYKRKQPP